MKYQKLPTFQAASIRIVVGVSDVGNVGWERREHKDMFNTRAEVISFCK